MVLPTLIAGPILRRVEATSVTVWLAFSKKQITKLVIWDTNEVKGTRDTTIEIKDTWIESALFETIEIATQLHIAVITVDTSEKKLLETKVYSYNIYYDDSGTSPKQDLVTAKLLFAPESHPEFAVLGYNQGALPTFSIPASTLENLHVVHGSCRKIHGGGDDAFRHMDSLIKKNITVENLTKRPQQLFHTGDQIYADEIPALVLPFINALGSGLFGNKDKREQLVIEATATESKTIPADMEHVPPNCRQLLVNATAKFTGNGVPSHLLSFQEYCSTYLFYWSQDVWDPELKVMLSKYKGSEELGYDDDIGSFHYYYLIHLFKNLKIDDVGKFLFGNETDEQRTLASGIKEIVRILNTEPTTPLDPDQTRLVTKWTTAYKDASGPLIADFDAIVKTMRLVPSMDQNVLASVFSLASVLSESRSSYDFLEVVPLARRALANIPNYMIFDDHEITDDWNFSQFWKNRVFTSPLGIQIQRNGLMAYTIFQDWGNVPLEYPYDLLKPSGDAAANQTKETAYKEAFKKTKGDKAGLLKKITEYGQAISGENPTEPPAALVNALDTLLLVGEIKNEGDPVDENAFVTPVRWHYDIPTGPARTYFLDTRTRREYSAFLASPGLLSEDALNDQLPEKIKDLNYPVVFVVSAAPALALPVIEEFAQPLSGLWQGGRDAEGVGGAPVGAISGALKRDNEAWGFSEKHLEMFLERLALFKKVVIFSGDIHFGCSTYADYWKERNPLNHARIIQLVSSSFKNGWDLDFILLKSGFIQRLLAGFDFEFEKHGWKDKKLKVKGNMAPRHRIRLGRNPIVLPRQGWYTGTTIDPPDPDWVWRLRIAVDASEYENFPEITDTSDPGTFEQFKLKVENDLPLTVPSNIELIKTTLSQMAERHSSLFKMGRTRRIVWQPHIGHVYFTKKDDPARFAVNHEFNYTCRIDGFLNSDYSPDPDTAAVFSGPFTVHTMNLDVSDKIKVELHEVDELTPPKLLSPPLPAT